MSFKTNANVNKPRLERPPSSLRDLQKYPITRGDICEEQGFTEQEQFDEFAKCANSAEYFIDNYCCVVHPKDGLVPCILYEYQRKDVLYAFTHERFVITRKFTKPIMVNSLKSC